MNKSRLYGFAVGAVVGAWPFWLLTLFRTARWPGWIAMAIAAALSATSARTPVAWILGMVAGVLGSWLALALLIGADWRLAVYTVILFTTYYLVSGLGMLCGAGLLSLRHDAARSRASGAVRPDS